MGWIVFCAGVVLLNLKCIPGIKIGGFLVTNKTCAASTLMIHCFATSADAVIHYSLTLSRNLTSTYQNLVTVAKHNSETVTKWADQTVDFQTRTQAKVTGHMTNNSSSLVVKLPDFDCSDVGVYRCILSGARTDRTTVIPYPSATTTLHFTDACSCGTNVNKYTMFATFGLILLLRCVRSLSVY